MNASFDYSYHFGLLPLRDSYSSKSTALRPGCKTNAVSCVTLDLHRPATTFFSARADVLPAPWSVAAAPRRLRPTWAAPVADRCGFRLEAAAFGEQHTARHECASRPVLRCAIYPQGVLRDYKGLKACNRILGFAEVAASRDHLVRKYPAMDRR